MAAYGKKSSQVWTAGALQGWLDDGTDGARVRERPTTWEKADDEARRLGKDA